MKKWIAFALVCVIALSLCACGGKIDEKTQEKLDLYEKYKEYIQLFEQENYEELLNRITALYDGQQNGTEPPQEGGPEPEIPTESTGANGLTAGEQAVLDAYAQIYAELQREHFSRWHDEEADLYYAGEAARTFWYEKYYRELQSLDLSVIDKWLGTEVLSGDVDWDYAKLLDRFTVLEDVPLFQYSTTKDRMGNEKSDIYAWIYAETGLIRYEEYMASGRKFEMIPSDPMNLFASNTEKADHIYDADGRPVQRKHYNNSGDVEYLVDIFYDDAGNKVKETVRCNAGEADILYTYDDQNRLIKLSYQDSINIYNNYHEYVIDYTYDDRGNLLRAENTNKYYGRIVAYEIDVYTYDDSGKPVSCEHTRQDLWNGVMDTQSEDHYTFRCDEQGRILFAEVAYGDTCYVSGSPNGQAGAVAHNATNVTGTFEFVYGDYVCFSFEK